MNSRKREDSKLLWKYILAWPILGTNGPSEGQSVEKLQCIGKWDLSRTLGSFVPQFMFLNMACGMQIKTACTTLWNFLERLT